MLSDVDACTPDIGHRVDVAEAGDEDDLDQRCGRAPCKRRRCPDRGFDQELWDLDSARDWPPVRDGVDSSDGPCKDLQPWR